MGPERMSGKDTITWRFPLLAALLTTLVSCGESSTPSADDATDDSATYANGQGNLTDGNFDGHTITFEKSCHDLATAGGTGGAFEGNDVDFAAQPYDVF